MVPGWTPLSDEDLDRQIEAARREANVARGQEPRAINAHYDRARERIAIELADGCLFAFPVEDAQGLRGATPEQLEKVEVVGGGYALHWEDLDVHFTVAGLVAGRLGSQVWMREHARRAGSVRSEAKARAARQNGLKGGRPRGMGERGKG